MAQYHLSASLIRRSAGRSATAAAAYRAADAIHDDREGVTHDYRHKDGVVAAHLIMPEGVSWSPSREALWSGVEVYNTRRNAQVAREFTIALPTELDDTEREALAVQFAQELADQYRIVADVAIHRPSKDGDQRNHHAHVLTTTSVIQADGSFGKKVRALDGIATKLADKTAPTSIDALRVRWQQLANDALAAAGIDARIDHRSYAERAEAGDALAAQMVPQTHAGPTATGMDRRGAQSDRADDRREAQSHNARVVELGDTEAEIRALQDEHRYEHEQSQGTEMPNTTAAEPVPTPIDEDASAVAMARAVDSGPELDTETTSASVMPDGLEDWTEAVQLDGLERDEPPVDYINQRIDEIDADRVGLSDSDTSDSVVPTGDDPMREPEPAGPPPQESSAVALAREAAATDMRAALHAARQHIAYPPIVAGASRERVAILELRERAAGLEGRADDQMPSDPRSGVRDDSPAVNPYEEAARDLRDRARIMEQGGYPIDDVLSEDPDVWARVRDAVRQHEQERARQSGAESARGQSPDKGTDFGP